MYLPENQREEKPPGSCEEPTALKSSSARKLHAWPRKAARFCPQSCLHFTELWRNKRFLWNRIFSTSVPSFKTTVFKKRFHMTSQGGFNKNWHISFATVVYSHIRFRWCFSTSYVLLQHDKEWHLQDEGDELSSGSLTGSRFLQGNPACDWDTKRPAATVLKCCTAGFPKHRKIKFWCTSSPPPVHLVSTNISSCFISLYII